MDEQVTMHTTCPQCHGAGKVPVEHQVLRLDTNETGWATVLVDCKACCGRGRRDGFQAPV